MLQDVHLARENKRRRREVSIASHGLRPQMPHLLTHTASSQECSGAARQLRDPSVWTRKGALEYLMRHPRDARPYAEEITQTLQDPQQEVRQLAIQVLETLGASGCSDKIAARFEDDEASVRLAALRAVESMEQSHRHHTAAASTLHDHDPQVRLAAMCLLKRLPPATLETYGADFALLLENEPSSEVCRAALSTIRSMGEAASPFAASVVKLLEPSKAQMGLRKLAVQVLKGLGEAAAPHATAISSVLADDDVHVRRAAVRLLGGLKEEGKRHKDAILQALADEDSEVRTAICWPGSAIRTASR